MTTGIVHEPIDTPIAAEHRINSCYHHRFVADIANLSEDLPAILFDFRFHLRELFGRASEDRNVGAERRQFMGRTATNAAAAAGDDNCLAFEEIRPEDRLIGHRVLRAPAQ